MANRYEIGKELGKGSFATVHLCRRKNGSDTSTRQYFAIKVINVTECKQQQGASKYYEGAPTNSNNGDNDEVCIQSQQQQNLVPYTIESLLQREINVHLSVSSSKHPNIVQLYESFNYKNEITGNEMSALVLEYCSFGDLQGYIKRIRHERKQSQNDNNGECSRGILLLPEGTFLSTNQIKHALSQVLCGLSFLHSRGIVHRDIKPANIFLSPMQPMSADKISPKGEENTQFTLLDCQIKLGDFGLSNKMQDDEDWAEAQRTFCGTPSCIAPEVVMQADSTTTARIHTKSNDTNVNDSILGVDASLFTQQTEGNHSRGYGQPADIWSTGCLLYTLIVGRNPFALPASQPTPNQDPSMEKTRRIQQIIERVKDNDWSVPANVRMNESMKQLLEQLLEASPKKRGTARKILSMHPFFQLNSSMPEVSPEKKIEATNGSLEKENAVNNQQEEDMSINSDHSYLFRSDSESEEKAEINPHSRDQPSDSISAAFSAAIEADTATLDLSLEVIEDLTKYQQMAAKSRPQTEPFNTHRSEEDKELDDIAKVSLTSTCQGIADLKEYHQAAAGSSSIVSQWSLSSSTARVRQKIDKTDDILSTIEIIKSTIGADDIMGQQDTVKATELLPSVEETPESHSTFVSMKALDRLPIKKYIWVESLSNSTSVRLTLFCLGTEGLVIQRETGSANDLWSHVSSDGEGILWGKLKPKSTSLSITSRLRATQSDEQLLMEAYSRAPTEFSKQTLSSLLSLKCNDIISLYESLEDKIVKIKAETPKVTLHLYTAAPADNTLQLVASTILLENEDIETKFVKDGTIIRLSSSDESITVRGETGTMTKLDVDLVKLKADDSPGESSSSKRMLNDLEPLPRFVNNLCVFIESARECLMIEAEDESSSQTQTDYAYPLEKKVVMKGWHRSDWISVQ